MVVIGGLATQAVKSETVPMSHGELSDNRSAKHTELNDGHYQQVIMGRTGTALMAMSHNITQRTVTRQHTEKRPVNKSREETVFSRENCHTAY